MTAKLKSKDRNKWAKLVAGVKDQLSKKQDELDKDGIERKAIDIPPDAVDDLRNRLCDAFPAMCEGEGEAVAEVMQVIIDALAEAQPDSDVEEERAEGDDEEEDKEDKEDKDEEIVSLTREVAELGKAYNELIKDVSEIVEGTTKVMQSMNTETKSYSAFEKRLAKIEKSLSERPRRASQATETELDLESKMAQTVKQRNMSDVPDSYKDMFAEGVE